jgi:ABC-type antimicrobial peptide transport system permease subunit
MGIRSALGATHGDQIRLVVGNGLFLAGSGIAIGVFGSLAVTRVLTSLLFGVTPHDPWTLGLVGVLLLLVATAACYAPARRATRVDPVVALRHE